MCLSMEESYKNAFMHAWKEKQVLDLKKSFPCVVPQDQYILRGFQLHV